MYSQIAIVSVRGLEGMDNCGIRVGVGENRNHTLRLTVWFERSTSDQVIDPSTMIIL